MDRLPAHRVQGVINEVESWMQSQLLILTLVVIQHNTGNDDEEGEMHDLYEVIQALCKWNSERGHGLLLYPENREFKHIIIELMSTTQAAKLYRPGSFVAKAWLWIERSPFQIARENPTNDVFVQSTLFLPAKLQIRRSIVALVEGAIFGKIKFPLSAHAKAAVLYFYESQDNAMLDFIGDCQITGNTDAGHERFSTYVASKMVSLSYSIFSWSWVGRPDQAAALTKLA
ncbi:uncharacterized protein F5147DRAFT_654745 [Suillus discolor]|uniref:Uncharacterized protein n=1 Tax=Suillus discolor TaxID=1912936 RepID=A0A9P7JRJ5_9AGAM|nr:uncharacterized protein F5147DRAFT_654745 [Suillus discolor]KAG2103434.1 hypothetical protein F5147DRAFT_654745 [Suillus discolor]